MSTQAKFSILLVNYKTPQMTPICLDLLRQAISQIDAEVWVVDNDSKDASTEYLRTLDWINLLERQPEKPETGDFAHGLALDLALGQIKTNYLFVMHTDTMVYDAGIFGRMLAFCDAEDGVAAVGCVDQVYRGRLRTAWRVCRRFLKHHARRARIALGVGSRPPKGYIENYLKSFFAVWNVNIMKRHGLTFALDGKTPGYAAQDRLIALGYQVKTLPASAVFRYLDHMQGGTKTFARGEVKNRRLRANVEMMTRLDQRISHK